MRHDLDPLFAPFRCGSLTLANRFVMSPMTRNFSPNGVPVPGVADYYARRAHMGLVITEGVGPDHPAALGDGTTGGPALPVLHGDAALASWRTVVDAVHAAGGKIAPQLWHMGPIRLAGTGPHPDAPSLSPSGLWGPFDRAMVPPDYLAAVMAPGQPMTDDDISAVIAGYARSAANAHALGFDAIALHGGHGYLLDSFLWAETNQRTDQWGGDLLRRTGLAREVVRAIRQVIPAEKPIIYRLSQWKLQDYGAALAQTPEELGLIAGALADAGVDIFDVSTRHFDAPAFAGSDMGLAGWVGKLTGKPVMTVGGIGFDKDLASSFVEPTTTFDNLEEVSRRFAAGEFDLVAIGRAALMDADWIGKARRGEPFNPFDMSAYGRLE
ncbi:12-oxophytodienoate reductase [Novosphingobium sp. AAP93]|uniref:oxidoreductase n=1 Tax=Novosphingobium sp. AAP93 TaxID=1523427 RepID=UPI0006B9560F|nr:12-oxophytodienoate reductase [Novosphingobium sp. AAP93]KPF84148.1 1,2-oxophytodienoate reductase [Novosphingobium sp. AAP93]